LFIVKTIGVVKTYFPSKDKNRKKSSFQKEKSIGVIFFEKCFWFCRFVPNFVSLNAEWILNFLIFK